jgi:S-methylmethionine-dependent homocysteine/selenocysteine methylase
MYDGGMGTEIELRIPESIKGEAWCGLAQIERPGAVQTIHEDFIQAGAEIITTNTYSTNRHVLGSANEQDSVVQGNEDAVKVARAAASVAGARLEKKVWVAGSISNHPPYFFENVKDASSDSNLTNTSQGWPCVEDEFANYCEQGELLKKGGVDFIILEMVKDIDHGETLCAAAETLGLPVFLGVTTAVREDGAVKLRDSDDLLVDGIKKLLAKCQNVVAINVMHTPMDEIVPSVKAVRTVWDGPVGVYPNNAVAADRHDWQGKAKCFTPDEFAEHAKEWVACGAQYVGGCCGFGPAHIKAACNVVCMPCEAEKTIFEAVDPIVVQATQAQQQPAVACC